MVGLRVDHMTRVCVCVSNVYVWVSGRQRDRFRQKGREGEMREEEEEKKEEGC